MYSTLNLLASPVSQLITVGGVELNNARRFIDSAGLKTMRLQFDANLAVRLDYSTDYGATWSTLIPAPTTQGAGPYVTEWQDVSWLNSGGVEFAQVLIRPFAVGSGLLTTVNFVQVDFQ